MKLQVTHRTTYSYDIPPRSVLQSHRLLPASFDGQKVLSWDVQISGGDVSRGAGFVDGAGDWIETVAIRGEVTGVTIDVLGEVETKDTLGVVKGLKSKAPPRAYMRASPMTALNGDLRDLASDAVAGVQTELDRAHALARAITGAIAYVPGMTDSQTSAAEALALGQGVCQDQSHALIAVARAVDMPGRYVTGYLHSTADGQSHEASHAWAELWVDGMGWVGFDAANACCPDEKYIRVGCGHDAVGAAPIRGISVGPGSETMGVTLTVMNSQQ